jgi:hypothetical protein
MANADRKMDIYHGGLFDHVISPGQRAVESWQQEYQDALQQVRGLGLCDPLNQAYPRIMQCGTSSPRMTQAFWEYVHGRNQDAQVTTLDLKSAPLRHLSAKIGQNHNMSVQANAIQLPFPDRSLDWIDARSYYFARAHSRGTSAGPAGTPPRSTTFWSIVCPAPFTGGITDGSPSRRTGSHSWPQKRSLA